MAGRIIPCRVAVRILAMTNRRRLIALLTTLSVAWAALWPLVSSAWALASSEPVALCHQAGMQVGLEEAPAQQGKQHCPLCIMAFYAALPPTLHAPVFFFAGCSVELETYCAPRPHSVRIHIPQSRAPPLLRVV